MFANPIILSRDMFELTRTIGIEVLKCKEGMNNKAYLLTMDNGSVVFAKLPVPCAGPAFHTTASEVATRTLVSNLRTLPLAMIDLLIESSIAA